MEKKRELQIIIAGTSASGKSRVAYIINKALREAGLTNIKFDLTDEIKDYGSEESYNKDMEYNLNKAIEAINQNSDITLQQKQVYKSFETNKLVIKK